MDQNDKHKFIEDLFEKGILIDKEMLEKILAADILPTINSYEDLVDWNNNNTSATQELDDKDTSLFSRGANNNGLTINQANNNLIKKSDDLEDYSAEGNLEQPQSLPLNSNSFVKPNELDIGIVGAENKMQETTLAGNVEAVLTYRGVAQKYKPQDFATIFVSRYQFLEKILRHRQELQRTLTINRIKNIKGKESVSVIGVVLDVAETKNNNILVKIEDPTGTISVVFSKNNKDLFSLANDIVLDEIIGIVGTSQEGIIFAENVIWPDLPENNELKKSQLEEHALFLSDIHVGSKLFLKKEFNKFLEWINGSAGNEQQRQLSQSIKYIFISGDVVDGVGVYPSQEDELEIKDIKEQYKEFTSLLQQIPSDKQIIICPGNHDVVHIAEPQPAFYQEYTLGLHQMPNVTLVSNPALVNFGKKDDFPGFDVLMYHGSSFDYYIANVDSIRSKGGYHRADLVMKFLLKRRHLAPSFRSTPYSPCYKEDPLLIKKIPDFFITGHIHYCCVANYKNVTMISGSCWQDKTTFQEKLGHLPEPARVPIVNLKTRQVKILKFN
ncbi:DNA-directed DNA polymerase II small subunit [Candidatus Woesearchaeota archaeon]|nr:DNA-directed DNA polymerase II small subunit [Candidatus Woesearchaeota archaeon]